MRGQSASDEGMSDVPMRLLIAAVLTSLIVPVFWGAYADLSENMTEGNLEKAASRLLDVVFEVMSGGTGSVMEAELEVEGFGAAHVDTMKIGGDLEDGSSEMYLIAFSVSGGPMKHLSLEEPVAMTSPDGEGLSLGEGRYKLRVAHRDSDGLHYAEIYVV